MDTEFTAKQAASLYGVSEQTISVYAREFSRHLSPSATPGHNRKRRFTEADMQVLSLIAEMKGDGHVYDDIHVSLDNGARGQSPLLDPDEVQALTISTREKRLALQVEHLQMTVARLTADNERLTTEAAQATEYQQQVIRLTVKAEMLTEQLTKAEQKNKEVDDLRQKLGEVTGELKAVKRQLEQGGTP